MSRLGITFGTGETLKADKLNLMVNAINDNDQRVTEAHQKAVNAINEVAIIKSKEVDIPQGEFDAMMESGTLDITKEYYTFEDEEE